MNELKFNIYGFTRPTTQAEVLALLDEALRMADQLDETIKAMGESMGTAEQEQPA